MKKEKYCQLCDTKLEQKDPDALFYCIKCGKTVEIKPGLENKDWKSKE